MMKTGRLTRDDGRLTRDDGQPSTVHRPLSTAHCPPSTVHRPPSLIIGYGNPLRGDDGVGWYAAEHLEQTIDDPQIQVVCCHQLTPELAMMVSQTALVIFIDAALADPARSEQTAGQIHCQAVTVPPPSSTDCSHHLTPSMLLECARLLYGTAPAAFLLTITGESFAYTAQLSPAVQASLPDVYSTVQALLAQKR